MVDIDIAYQGQLRCQAKHRPSQATFTTDAPVDNNGRGESFSPTDLVATGLGTCMITVMGIAARKKGLDLDGVQVHVKKVMTAAPPRRIARLEVELTAPGQVAARLDPATRGELEEAAHTCPVRLSLLPAIEVPVVFRWGT
jgi:putative redox protein